MSQKMNNIFKIYFQPAFVMCVITLAAAVMGMPAIINHLGVFFIKLPLPLKSPLDNIDKQLLSPYEVVHEYKIENPKVEEELGTKDYIQWELVDTEVPANSPVRRCSLFITYYTGNPDQVPHVPEECYTGGGNQQIGSQTLELNGIPLKKLTFGNKKANLWSADVKFDVLYFFKVNGEYAGGRDECRTYLQANLFSKYSYFSKVEWKFYNISSINTAIYPNKDEVVKASEKLLSVLAPVLEKNHWPDWKKANEKK